MTSQLDNELYVSSNVGGVNEQDSIVNKCANDWTAERAIIASNVHNEHLSENIFGSIHKQLIHLIQK